MNTERYYVYVYIDPRNFQEFYYGKGKGNRKNAHLSDEKDTEKTKIIAAINNEGLNPIIKVIAKDLTEQEAFLVEKTLIWKLGRNLANISSGHFQDKFRPHNTHHLELNNFDFENGIYYINVGEGPTRSWNDCRKFGFLSAGQGTQWSGQIRKLNPGDVVVAYVKAKGYVGIGKVVDNAKRSSDFKIKNKHLGEIKLENPQILKNSDNAKADFLVKIDWAKTVTKDNAKWKANSGLFTSQQIKVSLEKQTKTIKFLESEFELKFSDLMNT
jgi:uncharacterized protein